MSEEDANIFAQKENELLKSKEDLTRQLYEVKHTLEDIDRDLQAKEQIRDKDISRNLKKMHRINM